MGSKPKEQFVPILQPAQCDWGFTAAANCDNCDGTGYFTWTVEDGTGRDVEVDSVCGSCDGSGQEP